MAKKAALTEVANTFNNTPTINANFDAVNDKFDNTLSRDGSAPNQMEADIDLNGNDLLNVKDISMTGDLTVGGVNISQSVQNSQEAAAASATAAANSATNSANSATESAASAAEAALYEGPWVDSVTALLADTSLTYTTGQPGTVAAGDIVRTRDGFAYEVQASGGSGHVATAGGVLLNVLPGADGAYSVKAFGAVGDGVTDDTSAVQSAADEGVAFIPTGDFLVSPDAITLASGSGIVGNGYNSKLILSGLGVLASATGADNLTFRGVHYTVAAGVSGSVSGDKTNALVLTECRNVQFTGNFVSKNIGSQVRFVSCRAVTCAANTFFAGVVGYGDDEGGAAGRNYYPQSGADIEFYGSESSFSLAGENGKSIVANNLCFSNKDIGIAINQLGGDRDIVVTGNIVSVLDDNFAFVQSAAAVNRRHGIMVGYNGATGKNYANGGSIIVQGNHISNTLWSGVYAQDGNLGASKHGFLISGNIINLVGRAGTYYGNLLSAIYLTNPGDGTIISGNIITQFRGSTSAAAGVKITGNSTTRANIEVSGNVIEDSSGAGMLFGSNANIVNIHGNRIAKTDFAGMYLLNADAEYDVSGNLFEMDADVRCIDSDGVHTLCCVKDNRFKLLSGSTTNEAVYLRHMGTSPDNFDVSGNRFEGAFASGIGTGSYLTAGRNHWPIYGNTFSGLTSAYDDLLFSSRCFVFGNKYIGTPRHSNSVIEGRIFEGTKAADRVHFYANKTEISGWSSGNFTPAVGDTAMYRDTVASGAVGAVFDGTGWTEF